MTATFPLTVVSPANAIFNGQAALVEIPGTEGDFGVLADHAPVFSMIRPGIITIHGEVGSKRYFVTGGYADVGPEGTTILSENVYDLAETTVEQAEVLLAAAQKQLAAAETSVEIDKAQALVLQAEALRLALAH